METMIIAFPESMKHFVQERVTEGGYSWISSPNRSLRGCSIRRLGDADWVGLRPRTGGPVKGDRPSSPATTHPCRRLT